MGGRVKTLHPQALRRPARAARRRRAHARPREHEIEFVDLVCVNLYPFERTAARSGTERHEVIENIDIGGPTMIRAAAKNYAFTAVVVHARELRRRAPGAARGRRPAVAGHARDPRRRGVRLHRALRHRRSARWFAEKGEDFPPLHVRAFEKVVDLPYGENPHQRAAFYAQIGARMTCSPGPPAPRQAARRSTTCSTSTRRAPLVRDFEAPDLRDRQAQQPVRRRRSAPGRSTPTGGPSPATR